MASKPPRGWYTHKRGPSGIHGQPGVSPRGWCGYWVGIYATFMVCMVMLVPVFMFVVRAHLLAVNVDQGVAVGTDVLTFPSPPEQGGDVAWGSLWHGC